MNEEYDLNAFILLLAVGIISHEAIAHFSDPGPVASTTVIGMTLAGTLINLASAPLFWRSRDGGRRMTALRYRLSRNAACSREMIWQSAPQGAPVRKLAQPLMRVQALSQTKS